MIESESTRGDSGELRVKIQRGVQVAVLHKEIRGAFPEEVRLPHRRLVQRPWGGICLEHLSLKNSKECDVAEAE